ncbi:MAG: hypothetical protein ACREN7_03600 [Candidatus Dormibacteria bacterium]
MTLWLAPGLAWALICAAGAAWLGRRLRVLPQLLLLLAAAAVCLVLVLSLKARGPGLTVPGLGGLGLTRLPFGILVGGWAALTLQQLGSGAARLSGSGIASTVVVGVAACAALVVQGVLPMVLLLSFMAAFTWVRWQHLVGPLLPLRSLGRQTALALCALLAGAVLLPSLRLGAVPAAVVGMLWVGGLGALTGLLPVSSWVGAISAIPQAEAGLWRIWLIPVAVVALARVMAGGPPALTEVIQLLLVSLGLATAIFWACAACVAAPERRYWRVLQADAGLMCVGIGSGDLTGMAAALVLIVAHWLAGTALGDPATTRSRLLTWVGLTGIPPFGGFAGRFLVVAAVTFMGPEEVAVALLALGLLLAACGFGVRDCLRQPGSGIRLRELAPTASGLGVLALGLVVLPMVGGAFGSPL